jgi:hypothetical protein
MSKTWGCRVLGAAALLAASFTSQASLIINGDFEMNTIKTGSWAWLSSTNVTGWDGSNIEIWNAFNGVNAASGNNFIELNAHGANVGAWSIFQAFATDIGQQYELSFYYRARKNDKEALSVSLADVSWWLDDHTTKGWRFFSNKFLATDTTTTLVFSSGNAGSMGNFIDAVQVVGVSPLVSAQVPAPGGLAAFGLGVLMLAAAGRKRHAAE